MGKLSIQTGVYAKELISWAEKNRSTHKIYDENMTGNVYFVDIECDAECKRSLCILLEEIILYKNPITRGYKSINSNVRKLIFSPHKENIYNELTSFLEESDVINLEGYTDFRMDDYAHLVNLILYAVVKKSF